MSRFKKRNNKSRAASASPAHVNGTSSYPRQDPYERIRELEQLLKEKDEQLEHWRQIIEKLKKERGELRDRNSSLVNKMAEITRKQSVASFNNSPPRLPARPHLYTINSRSSISSLQPSNNGPTISQGSGSPPEINGLLETKVDDESETDYSDMEDEPVTENEVLQSEIDDVLSNVMSTVNGTVPPLQNHVEPQSQGKNVTSLVAKFQSKQVTSTPVATQPASNNHQELSRSGDQSLSPVPSDTVTPSQKGSGSEALANHLKNFFGDKRSGSESNSVETNGIAPRLGSSESPSQVRQTTPKPSDQDDSIIVVSSAQILVGTTSWVSQTISTMANGGVACVDDKGKEVDKTFEDSQESSVTHTSFASSKQDSFASDFSTSNYTTTDIESSFDLTSPPITPSAKSSTYPLKSALKNPSHLEGGVSSGSMKKRAVTLADMKNKPNFMKHDLTESVEDREDDVLCELEEKNAGQQVRSRTNTLAAVYGLRGRKPLEQGRRKKREIKKLKRQSSLTDISQAHKEPLTFMRELELISPDFEARIRQRICRAIGDKYGGLTKATKAATTIQRAYRGYKMKRQFLEIRKRKDIPLRKRAQSLRDPRRRPSILRRNMKYRREISVGDPTKDPLLKAKEAGRLLSKERNSHGHSGTRLALIHKKRSETLLEETVTAVDEPKEKTPAIILSDTDSPADKKESTVVVGQQQQETAECLLVTPLECTPTFKIDGACTNETSTDDITKDKVSNTLPTSFSSEQLERPMSIFSSSSSLGSSLSYQEDLATRSATTFPRLHKSKEKQKRFSMSLNVVKNIGVNYFNRKPTKGIQYLVMAKILDDDPGSVAEFLADQYGLSKVKIGEFVGEINSEFNMAVLECLVEKMDMGGKPIDGALRIFQQLFRMPGEAQKIDKIMEVFALEYFKHNMGTSPVKSEDAAYMLSFAIMMLHTSLHNPSVRMRTSKKQWVSMNRGCNDGSNFPEPFLLEIYDRIQSNEFTTGQDHTNEVIQIERQIVGSNIPKLSAPQRRFLLKLCVVEVGDLNVRPSFRNRHRRVILLFNDLIITCKQKRNEYQFKDAFSLLNLVPIKFETHYYKYGVQLHSSIENKVVLQCNCDSANDQQTLLSIVEDTVAELSMMESERIAELGTSLVLKQPQETGLAPRHRLTSGAGDLISSTKLSGSLNDLRPQDQGDFVPGVGDLAVSRKGRTMSQSSGKENRDSGFDSQQHSPTLTPSPSPTERDEHFHTSTPSPSHSTTPTPSSHTLSPPTTSPNKLSPPRSKSSDAIKTLTVIPCSPKKKSSGHGGIFRSNSNNPSPRHNKRHGSTDKKKASLFASLKSKKREASNSPPSHKKLSQDLTLSSSYESRERSKTPEISKSMDT